MHLISTSNAFLMFTFYIDIVNNCDLTRLEYTYFRCRELTLSYAIFIVSSIIRQYSGRFVTLSTSLQ